MSRRRKPCQDSGAYAPYPYRQKARREGWAWCGCCGHSVPVVITPGDPNRVPHYADHGMSGYAYRGQHDPVL
jgi:hypothetical protein